MFSIVVDIGVNTVVSVVCVTIWGVSVVEIIITQFIKWRELQNEEIYGKTVK